MGSVRSAMFSIYEAATPRFWFESLQNWQSEFLVIGAMIPPCTGSTTYFARQSTTTASCPPQFLASPSGASRAICKGFGRALGNCSSPNHVYA